MTRATILFGTLGTVMLVALTARGAGEVPPAFAPFEYLTGGWDGTGIPTANARKGWKEHYNWAWKFAEGKPAGMTVAVKTERPADAARLLFTKGQLSYDAASKRYRLDTTTPAGKPVAYVGGLNRTGKVLTLDRVGATPAGKERLTLQLFSNRIRFVLRLDRQEPGAPQFAKAFEAGLTKEGEAFAAGSSAADLPRCIITGGAATLTVSYQGKTYPVCCTGCVEEFQENPEKYVRKALLRAQAEGGQGGARTATAASRPQADDGTFAGLVDESKPAPAPAEETKGTKQPAGASAEAPKSRGPAGTEGASEEKPAAKAVPRTKSATSSKEKAASLLRLGQSLEKAGKLDGALSYYRRIVKDHPDTPQAKTAAVRIKAIEKGR